jgi:hypothetical protein
VLLVRVFITSTFAGFGFPTFATFFASTHITAAAFTTGVVL